MTPTGTVVRWVLLSCGCVVAVYGRAADPDYCPDHNVRVTAARTIDYR